MANTEIELAFITQSELSVITLSSSPLSGLTSTILSWVPNEIGFTNVFSLSSAWMHSNKVVYLDQIRSLKLIKVSTCIAQGEKKPP